ncbi:MAG: hypothetical protein R3F56_01745 [Planctomycetota bacterium]
MPETHQAPNLLRDLAVASPCPAEWNQMTGDAKRRFCQQCQLHVHDLSAMTRAEAEAVLRDAGGARVCVRFFRRHDGTVLTRDCPVGLRQRLRRARRRATAAVSAAFAALLSAVGCTRDAKRPPTSSGNGTDIHGAPADPGPTMGEPVQGDVVTGIARPTMGRPAMPVETPSDEPLQKPVQNPPR